MPDDPIEGEFDVSRYPARRIVIEAAHLLETLGHSGFDNMMLEFGISDLSAGRDLGGLMARANALAKHALEEPGAATAEGVPLAKAVVQRAIHRAKEIHTEPAENFLKFVAELTRKEAHKAVRSSVDPVEAVQMNPHPAPSAPIDAPRSEGLERTSSATPHEISKSMPRNGRIFIGHGKSLLWRELKDFVQDRLNLSWDEFNRVSIAGVTHVERLSTMLDEGIFALLVLTGEDELADGKVQARMNVVHEAGLFQGKLGFNKAIILLEEGCDEYGNIEGLGQLRFPKSNISAVFEKVRQVLEERGVVTH
jgi:hypothetical protein